MALKPPLRSPPIIARGSGNPFSGSPAGGTDEARATREICPYLAAAKGWRSVAPSREHRCTALEPPILISPDKQRRLCLVTRHVDCPAFAAAQAATEGARAAATGRTIARTTPVVLDRSRVPVGSGRLGSIGPGQAILVVLLVAVFSVIAIARLAEQPPTIVGGLILVESSALRSLPAGDEGSEPAAGGSVPSAAPASDPDGTATAPPESPAFASPPPSASAGPAGTPPLTGLVTYTIRPGDTLGAIARRYGTTVKAIMALNDIANASRIRPGQVIIIR